MVLSSDHLGDCHCGELSKTLSASSTTWQHGSCTVAATELLEGAVTDSLSASTADYAVTHLPGKALIQVQQGCADVQLRYAHPKIRSVYLEKLSLLMICFSSSKGTMLQVPLASYRRSPPGVICAMLWPGIRGDRSGLCAPASDPDIHALTLPAQPSHKPVAVL